MVTRCWSCASWVVVHFIVPDLGARLELERVELRYDFGPIPHACNSSVACLGTTARHTNDQNPTPNARRKRNPDREPEPESLQMTQRNAATIEVDLMGRVHELTRKVPDTRVARLLVAESAPGDQRDQAVRGGVHGTRSCSGTWRCWRPKGKTKADPQVASLEA